MTQHKRIGIALSGGGIRAAIFHLGALQYLAEAKLYRQISSISSVSGAGMAIGIILATHNNTWPDEDKFIKVTQPALRKLVLENSIQSSALHRLPFSPWYWRHRANLLATTLEERWGIQGTLQDLPKKPYWEINATTFETGGRFRMRRDYMGDSTIGYVQNPTLPISHAIAASAAFPVLIGPYILQTENLNFTEDKHGGPASKGIANHYTLWDGGVYDNLGLDALHNTWHGLDKEINFLIVSNASASLDHQVRRGNISVANLRRLLDIAQNQVNVLRGRQAVSSMIENKNGLYFKIGYTVNDIAEVLKIPVSKTYDIVGKSLSREDATRVRNYPTTLNSPTPADYDLIFRHGYENAKCVHGLLRL